MEDFHVLKLKFSDHFKLSTEFCKDYENRKALMQQLVVSGMDQNEDSFFEAVKEIIKSIPTGQVATYGQIAAYAGNPQGARQVAWVLHTYSEKEGLPWHRVINSKGGISLGHGSGYELQKALLEKEGVTFGKGDIIDLKKYQWNPYQSRL